MSPNRCQNSRKTTLKKAYFSEKTKIQLHSKTTFFHEKPLNATRPARNLPTKPIFLLLMLKKARVA
jgi:hypothetical protein